MASGGPSKTPKEQQQVHRFADVLWQGVFMNEMKHSSPFSFSLFRMPMLQQVKKISLKRTTVFCRWFNRRRNSTVNWLPYVTSTRSTPSKRFGFVAVFTPAVAKANNVFWSFVINRPLSKRLRSSTRMSANRWWNSWQGEMITAVMIFISALFRSESPKKVLSMSKVKSLSHCHRLNRVHRRMWNCNWRR